MISKEEKKNRSFTGNRKKMSLGLEIGLLFGALIFVVVGIFSFILYERFYEDRQNAVMDGITSAVRSNENEIDSLLERMNFAVKLTHDNDTIYEKSTLTPSVLCQLLLEFQSWREYVSVHQLARDFTSYQQSFNEYFSTCFGENVDYSNTLFVNSALPIQDYLYAAVLGERNGCSTDRAVQKEEWYQKAVAAGGEAYWFMDEEDPDTLYMAQLLTCVELMAIKGLVKTDIGVLVIGIDTESFKSGLDSNTLTEGSEIFLVNQSNEVVYSESEYQAGIELTQSVEIPKGNGIWESTYKGEACLVFERMLPLGLSIVTIVPTEDIRHLAFDGVQIVGVVAVLAIAIAVVAIICLSMVAVAPIKRLADHMESGNTGVIFTDRNGAQELDVLYESFNHLITGMKESTRKVLDANEKQKRAEIRAMQAQINPHFIYNTLNSVSCLAMVNGEEDIADALNSLTRIMRYSISNPEELVTVTEEIEIIRQYEEIQKFCYWDGVSFEYDIDSDASDVLIPKLVIQPLIENSLIHGVNPQNNSMKVCLKVRKLSGKLMISVWDSGTQADIEQMNLLLKDEYSEERKTSDSLGIHNVYGRIHMIFGEDATLYYRKDENGNTVATIIIPFSSESGGAGRI